jgi:hypothetical protein
MYSNNNPALQTFSAYGRALSTSSSWRLTEYSGCSAISLIIAQTRSIAFDQATIKGIVDRLNARGIVELCPDPSDKRRRAVVRVLLGRSRSVMIGGRRHSISTTTQCLKFVERAAGQ